MKTPTFQLFSAAALGFAAAAICFSAWSVKPASAQFKGAPALGQLPGSNIPLSNGLQIAGGATTSTAQPLAIQALDNEHFVVVSREPRLVQQIGREGTAQNMMVTVVTHYTVRGERLLPIEKVNTPAGYRAVTIESEN